MSLRTLTVWIPFLSALGALCVLFVQTPLQDALATSKAADAYSVSADGSLEAKQNQKMTTKAAMEAWRSLSKRIKIGKPATAAESIMNQRQHGTCEKPVQQMLRWQCDVKKSDEVCCFNRHYAEFSGYFQQTPFLQNPYEVKEDKDKALPTPEAPVVFNDAVTGKPLFVAPGPSRDWEAFVKESMAHGWPSFRNDEVVADNVRVLGNGECVSVDGTHLGHNIPDQKGDRYCINLVSIAGHAAEDP